MRYLVSHGISGLFGNFDSGVNHDLRRGDRVFIHSSRGDELGMVLRPFSPVHTDAVADVPRGTIVRLASPDDLAREKRAKAREQLVFEQSRKACARFQLPIIPMDAEILLDGKTTILHVVELAKFNPLSLIESFSAEMDLALHFLVLNPKPDPEPEPEGCGSCGSGGGSCGSEGGCGSCGSGGGCGSCHEESHVEAAATELSRVALL